MSRVVHILKLYENHATFIEFVVEKCLHSLLYSKTKRRDWREDIDKVYQSKNRSEFYKGLSMPRLKILVALVAQKNGIDLDNHHLTIKLKFIGNLKTTPLRFQQKFIPLLVNGIWLLGTAIKDSLSQEPQINCGNLFGFEQGDLGFWWASLVILDWLSYRKAHTLAKVKHIKCIEFYNDSCMSRKYKYNQNSGMSSLDRIPQQFLDGLDLKNFHDTIDEIFYTSYVEILIESQERKKRNELDDEFQDFERQVHNHLRFYS